MTHVRQEPRLGFVGRFGRLSSVDHFVRRLLQTHRKIVQAGNCGAEYIPSLGSEHDQCQRKQHTLHVLKSIDVRSRLAIVLKHDAIHAFEEFAFRGQQTSVRGFRDAANDTATAAFI